MRVDAAGKIYKQVQFFPYLGDTVIETPGMSTESTRRTSACWMCIRRYLRELYDQPKAALSFKTRMVKAEAIEALLYQCSTWTLRQEHHSTPSYTTGCCFALSVHTEKDQATG